MSKNTLSAQDNIWLFQVVWNSFHRKEHCSQAALWALQGIDWNSYTDEEENEVHSSVDMGEVTGSEPGGKTRSNLL